jgi:EmrB/QacA subfamily drug resistance transporter
MATENSLTQPARLESDRRLHGVALGVVLISLMLTLLLEAMDQTIVGTAMPRIIADLHGLDRYTWVVTSYLLASTTMIPVVGKLSDQFGRKWFLVGGTALFLAGSALCGAAQTIDQLILYRAVQGLGGGIGIALVFTVVGDIFPPGERARWQGIVSAVYTISAVAGPTFGGWLADHGPLVGSLVTADSRWRWVFYINIPLGTIALAGLLIYLPADISVRSNAHTGWAAVQRIDVRGAALAAAATLALLIGLTWGGEGMSNWGSLRVLGALVTAAFLYAALIMTERGAEEPILPLELFRKRVYAADSALSLLVMMALLGMASYTPLFLQGVLGISAAQSGAVMTSFSVSIAVSTSVTGIVIAALRRYQAVVIAGALIMTVGIYGLSQMTPMTELLHASILVGVAGLGMGTLLCAVTVISQNTLSPMHMGVGTAAVRYIGQVGGVIGVSIVGNVVNLSLARELHRRIPDAAVRSLHSEGIDLATSPQVLIGSAYRKSILDRALEAAAANVPAGPHHDQSVAVATSRTQHLVDQVFEASRLSLAIAIQHGLVTVFLLCLAVILVALFVRDVPMVQARSSESPENAER